MSLRKRGPNEDWEFLPATARARVLAWESLPLGRIALLGAALLMAYLVLSGTFSSGEVSLDTGNACENVLLRDESQQIAGNDPNRPGAYGQCVQPTPTPVQRASAPTRAPVVPIDVATDCNDPGYDATLLSPSVPGSSDTYTYVIDGCRPDYEVEAARIGIQTEDVDYVEFSGCWQVEDVKDVYVSGGSVEMIAPGYVVVTGINDDDMPLTVEIVFHLSLKSGEERTWIWVHAGPAASDGWTYRVGGPFCEESSQTPSPPPTPGPSQTPSPSPPPTPSATPPPTPSATSSPTPSATPSPTPTDPTTPVAELTIVKTDSPDPVAIGGTLAYTVTVSNIGAITAEDVLVTDTLPGHVSLISSTPSQGSCEGTLCALGSIAAGESAVISYVALVTEGAGTSLVNVACVLTSTTEGDLTNNCDEEETTLETTLGATSTPDSIPPMGGNPLDGGGSAGLSLLLALGTGLAVIGSIAGLAARRRVTNTIARLAAWRRVTNRQ